MNIVHILHGKANPQGHNGISRVVYFLNKHEKMIGNNSQIWAVADGVKTHETLQRDRYVTVEVFPRVTVINRNSSGGICRNIKDNRDKIDIVHFHMIWFYDKNMIARTLKYLGIPFIITTHGTYSKPHAYTGKRLIAKWLYEVKYLNMADEIHALQRDEGFGNMKYGVKVPQFIVPNGIDSDEIPESRTNIFKEDSQKSNKIKLLWIGVFREDKNLGELLKAISRLPREIRTNISLILAGPDYGGNRKKLTELADTLEIQDIVCLKDAVYEQNKYDLIESCDVYVMPSLSEGISMAILDALACGKPCILTKQCGMEYYYDKNFYFMCEPYADDIARAITEMYGRRAELPRMGLNAKTLVQTEFNWHGIAHKMVKNYERIVRNRNESMDRNTGACFNQGI